MIHTCNKVYITTIIMLEIIVPTSPLQKGGMKIPKYWARGDDLKKACEQNQNVEDKIQKSKGNENFLFSQY